MQLSAHGPGTAAPPAPAPAMTTLLALDVGRLTLGQGLFFGRGDYGVAKTDLLDELGEHRDVGRLTREVRRIAERADEPAPARGPVQEELRAAVDALGLVYAKACQTTGQ